MSVMSNFATHVDGYRGVATKQTALGCLDEASVRKFERGELEAEWSAGATARLGVKRTTLYCKMKRLGIAPPSDNWEN